MPSSSKTNACSRLGRRRRFTMSLMTDWGIFVSSPSFFWFRPSSSNNFSSWARPGVSGDEVAVTRHAPTQYRKYELSQVRTEPALEESANRAVIPREVGRSKKNLGRKGLPLPPEMAGYAERPAPCLQRPQRERRPQPGRAEPTFGAQPVNHQRGHGRGRAKGRRDGRGHCAAVPGHGGSSRLRSYGNRGRDPASCPTASCVPESGRRRVARRRGSGRATTGCSRAARHSRA
jgi:hypothetical protein